MLQKRLNQKANGKFASMPINQGDDGIPMLSPEGKNYVAYRGLLDHCHIKTYSK